MRLLQEKQKYLNLLNFFEDYPVLQIRSIGNSALVLGRSDREWLFVCSDSEQELKSLAQMLHAKEKCFAAVEDWMLPLLARDKQVAWTLTTNQYFLPGENSLPRQEFTVSPLVEADADTVYTNSEYKEFLTLEYVSDRIHRGLSASIRVGDQPVAWVMTQDDGAIGFLHVLNSHRKKGYARALTIALSTMLREKGRLPFACVKETNQPAISLMNQLGFVKDKRVHWLGLL